MNKRMMVFACMCMCMSVIMSGLNAQVSLKGMVSDAASGDAIIGGSVIIKGTTVGTITDWDGSFEFETENTFPFDLEVSYVGYTTKIVNIEDDSRIDIRLEEDAVLIEGVEVKASRISEKQKESPLTIEALDIIAIKETPAADFYDGLGALKGVDLTAASLGFKVINTRGFNSTSPVRSLQTIDGVDNQAPGLNFSLGNFLGSSELDIQKVEIVVGASSAFYGPNAFNGVIAMETKDPFYHNGLSAMVKFGERNMFKSALRYADVFNNKNGDPVFAFKINGEYLRADDWIANNYDQVYQDPDRDIDPNPLSTENIYAVTESNPGRYDAVNTYGDEYQTANDFSTNSLSDLTSAGLGVFHRNGYNEIDLVDYDTRNYKANASFHLKTNPSAKEQSPELIFTTNYGSGTTVYQGDNRFSLRGITFFQNRIEFRKKNNYFIRAYTTKTGAGDSYDPYFTALLLQENAKDNFEWSSDYVNNWQNNSAPVIKENGYPQTTVTIDPNTGLPVISFDAQGAVNWLGDNQGLLATLHEQSLAAANGPGFGSSQSVAFYEPGTDRFNEEFNRITNTLRGDDDNPGTKFFDNSALYHVHGEYIFRPTWADKITVGSNFRLYTPDSKGTVFADRDTAITNNEIGLYGGIEKSFFNKKVKTSYAVRADKNQNFGLLVSPAASIVYAPSANNFFRMSFSSAIRNPTLQDQYLLLDVGPATLAGNLNGVQDLITIESFTDFRSSLLQSDLEFFDIGGVQPEEVNTFEFGFRTTLFEKLYLDAGYYYSVYTNFLGFNLGIDAEFSNVSGLPTDIDVFRYAANSQNQVETQGMSIGANYYLGSKYSVNGNYSWNKLQKTVADDPIIPAFNTPEHKYNLGFSGRKLTVAGIKNVGFNVNYKWIQGFLFEGSPQFTGFIPTYDMLDAQFNVLIPSVNTTVKVGASNIMNNKSFQTYGGPRIGRLAYIMFTYEPK